MANTTEVVVEATTRTTAKVAKATTTKPANITEAVVVLPAKTLKAVASLAKAREAEKKVKARLDSARTEILAELSLGVTVVGTDTEGNRKVKVQVIPATDKIDTLALMAFLATHYPEAHAEAVKAFTIPAGEPTLRVSVI